jgi:hypothetical protein
MKTSKMVLVGVFLIALTQLAWSQNKGLIAPHQKGIDGYLDPRTGAFTPRTQNSGVKAEASPDFTGTSIVFREQFNITITNDDQSTSDLVSCQAHIFSVGDPNSWFDKAVIVATRSGSTYTCDVPVLASWTLQNPGSDTISACVKISFNQGFTVGPNSTVQTIRQQNPPCLTLSVPANGSTVVNTMSLTM